MAISTDISTLVNTTNPDPYTARASVTDKGVDPTTTTVTGDRNDPLFSPAKVLGKQDFLQLLVKQLQYQDPLNPMNNTDMVAQLAQFSALEGNNNIEKAVNGLNDSFKDAVASQKYSANSMTNASAVSLIGKEVRLQVKDFRYLGKADSAVKLNINLGEAQQATVRIVDSEGKTVKTLNTKGKDAENSTVVTWNGITDQGVQAAPGTYSVTIDGADTNPMLYAFAQDRVEGVRFATEGPLVKVGGREISIANIMDVSIGSQSKGFDDATSNSAVSLLGKNIRWKDSSSYSAADGQGIQKMVSMGNLSYATVEVLNKAGEVVNSFNVSGLNGVGVMNWDGRIAGGADFAEPGQYYFRVAGEDQNSALYCYSEGRVDGVSSISGTTYLRIGGNNVPFSDILDISTSSAQEA
jgi:flagellar basal-body rod modification protein FlgD